MPSTAARSSSGAARPRRWQTRRSCARCADSAPVRPDGEDRTMRPIVRSWLPRLPPALLILVPLVVPAQDSSPLSAEEEISLTEIRDFVAATAQRYRMVAPLQVSVAPWVGNPSLSQYAGSPAVYARGSLFVNRRLLRAAHRGLVIATAPGYAMLRG